MAQYVLAEGLSCPDKTALAVVGGEGDETWSYADLRAGVLGTARGLLQAGAVPGDRVLMRPKITSNSPNVARISDTQRFTPLRFVPEI